MKKVRYADEDIKDLMGAINSGKIVVDDPAQLDVPILDGVEKDMHKKVSMNEFGEISVSRLSLDEIEQARRDVAQVNKVAEMVEKAEIDSVRRDVDAVRSVVDEYNLQNN